MPKQVLYVDVASYYFVKAYEKAPEKCHFPTTDSAKCVGEAVKAEHLPDGWIDVPVAYRSALEEKYYLDAFREGIAFSVARHQVAIPKILDPKAIEKIRDLLGQNSDKASSNQYQSEYDRLRKACRKGQKISLKKWGEVEAFQKAKLPPKMSEDALLEHFKKTKRMEEDFQKVYTNYNNKRAELWRFLVEAKEKGIEILTKGD